MTQTTITQSRPVSAFVPLAALSACLWAATAVAHLAHTQSEDDFGPTGDYVIEALFFAALLGSAAAFTVILPMASGRTAKAGTWLTAIGHALLAASALSSLLAGTADGWLGPLFPLGLLSIAIGLVLLNANAIRAEGLMRWFPPLLLLAWVIAIALPDANGGIFALAVAWLAGGALSLKRSSL